MNVHITATQILAGLGIGVLAVLMWRVGTRRARRAAEKARAGARAVSLAGRVLLMGAAMVGLQWVIIANPGNPTLLIVVLALPDLIAAHVLTKALTVTSLDTTRRRDGGGRR